jgi:hypothetical protein
MKKRETTLYRAIDVWKRVDDETLARYRCFEVLPDKGFCVHTVEFHRPPFSASQTENFETHFLEKLLEGELEECSALSPSFGATRRGGFFATLLDAINAHDREFGE